MTICPLDDGLLEFESEAALLKYVNATGMPLLVFDDVPESDNNLVFVVLGAVCCGTVAVLTWLFYKQSTQKHRGIIAASLCLVFAGIIAVSIGFAWEDTERVVSESRNNMKSDIQVEICGVYVSQKPWSLTSNVKKDNKVLFGGIHPLEKSSWVLKGYVPRGNNNLWESMRDEMDPTFNAMVVYAASASTETTHISYMYTKIGDSLKELDDLESVIHNYINLRVSKSPRTILHNDLNNTHAWTYIFMAVPVLLVSYSFIVERIMV
jgi:H+/Cl- antiporter ClcA